MDNQSSNLLGGLSGAALAGVAWWSRLDDDTQRRLRNLREATNDANDKIDGWLNSPDLTRLLIPTVRDLIAGIAYSAQPTTQAQTIPNLSEGISRPSLSQESAVRNYQWPPKAGAYDANGRVSSVGELTPAALMLTYQEVRAALNGLTQPAAPSPDGLVQIQRVFHALTMIAAGMGLTLEQYKTAWQRLFSDASGSFANPHQDPQRAPSASTLAPGVTIVPLSNSAIPSFQYANRNTDESQHWRIACTGAIAAGTPVALIQFGTEYRTRLADGSTVPFQPSIPLVADSAALPPLFFGAYLLTSSSFQIVALSGMNANSSVDLHFTVSAGQPVVS